MRVVRFLTLLFFAWSLMVSPSHGATEIPFTFRGGMIWLKVEVAGHSAPLNFLLDSGAGKSALHLGTAQQLGVTLGARETVQGVQGRCAAYRVESLAATVGSTPLPAKILALDLSAISAGCGAQIDGLLGADFFRDHIVRIDFAKQSIRLLNRAESASCSGQVLPLARRNDALCLRVGVNGCAPQWMRLDTGYSGALEWVAVDTSARRIAGTSMAAAAASRQTMQTEVLVGSECLSAVKTGVSSNPIFAGEAGLVGNGLLSKFVVTVDAAKSRLLLRRVAK